MPKRHSRRFPILNILIARRRLLPRLHCLDMPSFAQLASVGAGLRVLKPGAKWWPGWADCYNNLRWVPQIQSPVIVLHVRPKCPVLQAQVHTVRRASFNTCCMRLLEVSADKLPCKQGLVAV